MVYTKHIMTNNGRIWDKRPATTRKGLMSIIVNKSNRKNEVRKPVFRHACFNVKGDQIATIDERGNVFVFHVAENRYALVNRAGYVGSTSNVSFSPRHVNEFSVAINTSAKKQVVCMQSNDGQILAALTGHRKAITVVRYHPTSTLMATASVDKVILWDTASWRQKRTLDHGPGVVDVCFSAASDALFVLFRDGRVLAWGAHTFELEMELKCPLPPIPDPVSNDDLHRSAPRQLSMKCMCMSSDGQYLFVGASAGACFVFDVTTQHLLRLVQMPDMTGNVVEAQFVEISSDHFVEASVSSLCLFVLGDDGVARLIAINKEDSTAECSVIHEVQLERGCAILSFVVDRQTKYLCACTSDGSLALFDLAVALKYQKRLRQNPAANPFSAAAASESVQRRIRSFSMEDRDEPAQPSQSGAQPPVSGDQANAPRPQDDTASWRPQEEPQSGEPAFPDPLSAEQVQHIHETPSRTSVGELESNTRSSRFQQNPTDPLNDTFKQIVEITPKKQRQAVTRQRQAVTKQRQAVTRQRQAVDRLHQSSNKQHQTFNRHHQMASDNDDEEAEIGFLSDDDDSGPSPPRMETREQSQSSRTAPRRDARAQEPGPPHVPLSSLVRGLSNDEMLMNPQRLRGLVDHYGALPAKYRMVIWRCVLELPENDTAYRSLLAKGEHPVWKNLSSRYPVRDRRLAKKLDVAVSALSHWSPVFSEVSYLPALVFPFVHCFQSNDLVAFEMLLTVLLNWCASWFDTFPHPPIPLLTAVESALEFYDKELFDHLVSCKVSSQVYAWTLLRSVFTEVLDREEWLQFWDNLIVRKDEPQLLNCAVVAYLVYFRSSLLTLKRVRDFEHFFRHQNALSMRRFNKLVLRVAAGLTPELLQKLSCDDANLVAGEGEAAFTPVLRLKGQPVLPAGQYPVFYRYPKFVVDFRAQERVRIEAEEAELLRKRELVNDIEAKMRELEKKEATWKQHQERLLSEEQVRLEQENQAFESRHAEKMLLLEKARTARLEQLQKMEEAAASKLSIHQQLREAELKRLNERLENHKRVQEAELETLRQDEAVKKLEFQATQRVTDMASQREIEQELSDLRHTMQARVQKQQADLKLQEEQWATEDARRALLLKLRADNQEKFSKQMQVQASRRELESRALMSELQVESTKNRLLKERALRQLSEEAVFASEQELRGKQMAHSEMENEELREKQKMVREQQLWLEKVRQEREALLEEESRKLAMETELRQLRLEELQRKQRQRQFQDEIRETQSEERAKLLKEEKELQETVLALEKKRAADRKAELELLLKEKEIQEKAKMADQAREATEAVLLHERMEFQEQSEQRMESVHEQERQEIESHERSLAREYVQRAKWEQHVDDDVSPTDLAEKARRLIEQNRRELGTI